MPGAEFFLLPPVISFRGTDLEGGAFSFPLERVRIKMSFRISGIFASADQVTPMLKILLVVPLQNKIQSLHDRQDLLWSTCSVSFPATPPLLSQQS